MRRLCCLLVLSAAVLAPATVTAKTSHAGWPKIDGLLKINHDSADATYTGVPDKHNELLGGHGDDTLNAGDAGDVLWGDYNPSGQPTGQTDVINGGAGKDFIYASHGRNTISTGGGADQVHVHYGHGSITCASPAATIFISHRNKRNYKLRGCRKISYKTVGH